MNQPDIIVASPDGEYLMIVEVKLKDVGVSIQNIIEQIKHLMASIGCSVGLIVCGERVVLLRDSLEKSHGESIKVVGEAKLPSSLLPAAEGKWQEEPYFEFESRVQQWLEKLKVASNTENLPNDLKQLFGESVTSLLQFGEIRAARPRWSKALR